MTTPQAGLFAPAAPLQLALEFDAPALDGPTLTRLRQALGSGVLALGAGAYRRLGGEAAVADLPAIPGMADTPRDVLLWFQDSTRDRLFDTARAVDTALGGGCALEVWGFIYHDSRDLTGFIDGTANPQGEAARSAALVPADAPGAGGSHVLTQKWRHDLAAFHALSTAEQERVIGRTKNDSIELTGAAMPATSHVSRTDAALGGVPQKIYRRSFPWGGVRAHGLYFLAFACDAARHGFLLQRMFGAAEDGVRDHLTAYSRAESGAQWFAPSCEELDRMSA